VAALNALARAEREAAGLLGPERLLAAGREWSVGDRLSCRRNDYRLGVRNGTRGSVVALDLGAGRLGLRDDEARTVLLPAAYLEHADYGHADTGHVSQGETVDRAYLMAGPGKGGREWACVAGSRHRVDLRVYAVDREGARLESALAAAWGRSQAKRLALDFLGPNPQARSLTEAHIRPVEVPESVVGRVAARDRGRNLPPTLGVEPWVGSPL
jgi:ATP-dependent exoDNAse (exonuclease V) alpha subunit